MGAGACNCFLTASRPAGKGAPYHFPAPDTSALASPPPRCPWRKHRTSPVSGTCSGGDSLWEPTHTAWPSFPLAMHSARQWFYSGSLLALERLKPEILALTPPCSYRGGCFSRQDGSCQVCSISSCITRDLQMMIE